MTTNPSPASTVDQLLTLISVALLVGLAYAASGIAGHSDNARTAVLLILVGVTFVLTLNLGLYDPHANRTQTIMQLPWNPQIPA